MNLTDEQKVAIDRLQSGSADVSPEDRQKFVRAIVSVPREELDKTPEPPKEKRGPKPALRTTPVSAEVPSGVSC